MLMNKDEQNTLKKILDYLKNILKVNTEHKEISKEQTKKSISKNEQRIWYIITIIVMISLGIGVISKLPNNKSINENLKIDVLPEKIILNEKGDINFEIKFTNTGKINITDFNVLQMDLYRIENNRSLFKRQIIAPFYNTGYTLSCTKQDWYGYQGLLPPSESCTIKTKMNACPECFDDKDKQVQLFIYFKSVPPIKNEIVNIPIY